MSKIYVPDMHCENCVKRITSFKRSRYRCNCGACFPNRYR